MKRAYLRKTLKRDVWRKLLPSSISTTSRIRVHVRSKYYCIYTLGFKPIKSSRYRRRSEIANAIARTTTAGQWTSKLWWCWRGLLIDEWRGLQVPVARSHILISDSPTSWGDERLTEQRSVITVAGRITNWDWTILARNLSVLYFLC